jgi:hypothetical protein
MWIPAFATQQKPRPILVQCMGECDQFNWERHCTNQKIWCRVAMKRFFGTQQSIDADLDFFQEEAEREAWLSF